MSADGSVVMHPLRGLLADATGGRFPAADLALEIFPSAPGRSDAVVAFSGHNVIAAAVSREEVETHLPGNDPGAPMSAPFLTWLGTRLNATPGMLDVVLVAKSGLGTIPPIELVQREDTEANDRVARALRHRTDVVVYSTTTELGMVILGRGLAGRLEVSIEVDPDHRGRGLGSALARAAVGLVANEPLFAQVSPGNVASLHAFLAAGYRPICSEVLFLREA